VIRINRYICYFLDCVPKREHIFGRICPKCLSDSGNGADIWIRNDVKDKGKVVCFSWAPRHEGVLGEWRYSSTCCLTLALDVGEWWASRPGRFTPGERAPGTHCIEGWVGRGNWTLEPRSSRSEMKIHETDRKHNKVDGWSHSLGFH